MALGGALHPFLHLRGLSLWTVDGGRRTVALPPSAAQRLPSTEGVMGFFRGVILDVDGTLVDSNDAHAWAWVDTLSENGMAVPFERVRPLIGMGSDKLLPALTGIQKESDFGKRLTARRDEIFKARYLPNLEAAPGARALLERMPARRQFIRIRPISSRTTRSRRWRWRCRRRTRSIWPA